MLVLRHKKGPGRVFIDSLMTHDATDIFIHIGCIIFCLWLIVFRIWLISQIPGTCYHLVLTLLFHLGSEMFNPPQLVPFLGWGGGGTYWAPQWGHIAFHVCTWRFKTTTTTIFYSLNSISDLNLPTIPFKVSSLWSAVSVPALLLSLDRSLEVPFRPFLGMHLQCPIKTVQLECHFKEEYGVKQSSSDCKQLKMSWACSLSSGNLSHIFADIWPSGSNLQWQLVN